MDIVSALRTFLRVVETTSFSAAAQDLNLTQPAVSRQVSALEAHLNVRLLHRTTSALALTAEGERIIPMALRVLEAVDDLGDSLGHNVGAAAGRVRLSVPAPLGLFLSDRLEGLLSLYPGLFVELLFREEASDLIQEGIDLEVRLGPVADNGLICRRIGWTTAFLVAAPSYRERCGLPSRPEDLAVHDCICYQRAAHSHIWSFSDGAGEIPVRITPRLTANNAVAVHRATRAGSGLSVLSHILAVPDIESGALVDAMPDFRPTRLPINVVYSSRRNMPLRIRTVVEFLIDAVRSDPLMRDAEG
ncbi:LysR family transcriptional regulator [Shinella kummerowiae]|uniref:LysR family transcriptional regulator n=1 Tax=Shinella kummerowiae TaxID=417745 RepID=A0A6N8SCQ4_9HYPH|nr:LysR family transcriptional regulator [Shinella kummerowiae]MXN45318.1 LysR family transcriptional regulator [Shinella kummerowiae]